MILGDPPAVMASALENVGFCLDFLPFSMARRPWFDATDLVVPPAAWEDVCGARRPRGVLPLPRIMF